MEVERARKRSYAREKKQQERREMNPVSDRQPIEQGMRYANMRSAMAGGGVIHLLLQDDSLFPEQMPVLPEDFPLRRWRISTTRCGSAGDGAVWHRWLPCWGRRRWIT